MRRVLIPLMALACIAASGEASVEITRPDPPKKNAETNERFKDMLLGNAVTDFEGKTVTISDILRDRCRDRLGNAHKGKRDAPVSDAPLFNREPSTPDNPPLAIYAVDQREGGCGVMVMMGNLNDVRPVPRIDADDHRLMPSDTPEE